MGEYKAGLWIIGILTYFFLFFLVTHSALNAMAAVGIHDTRVVMNDPGFQARGGLSMDEFTGRCVGGGGRLMSWASGGLIPISATIDCGGPGIGLELTNEVDCNNVNGCSWSNGTNLFNLTVIGDGCNGKVNLSYYNITNEDSANYCTLSNLTTQGSCEFFGCEWLSVSDILAEDPDLSGGDSIVSIWETFKFVSGFRAELGIGRMTFIFSFIFFYLPLITLSLAIYFSLPFLH